MGAARRYSEPTMLLRYASIVPSCVVHEAHRELIDTEFITLGEALSMVRNRAEKTESFDDLVGANVASGLPTLP